MSTHQIEVVRLGPLEKHPNADTLSLVKVWGWTVVVRTDDWKDGDLAVFIPPDYVVDTNRLEFIFLDGHPRIKVKKLRGIVSQGLLIPAPASHTEGDDVMDLLGITRYVPPEPTTIGGDSEPAPEGYRPNYDVESFQRYPNLFEPGEAVIVCEKLHGTSSRFCFADGRMCCGSRTSWKKESESSAWWKALRGCPELEAFCRANPDLTVYGEVYGVQGDMPYGRTKGKPGFAAFDILEKGLWWDRTRIDADPPAIPWVPVLWRGPYDETRVRALAEGPSLIGGADHLREGCVVRPVVERTVPELGRVQLKIVSDAYLMRR